MTLEEKKKPSRVTLSTGRKELNEIVETCDAISDRKFNPFFLDVNLGVETLRRYFPLWERFDDHCLDAHTINRLSEVVRLQNTQLKFQSSTLYADPEFIARKIERMSEKRLAEVFLQSWHPLVELEQLTGEAFATSLDYWNALRPIEERWKRREHYQGRSPGKAGSDTLAGLGIHGEEFSRQLIGLWEELRRLFELEHSPIEYWRFVQGQSYAETVQRAYFVSFLVTYGYAKLGSEVGQLALTPINTPSEKTSPGAVSFPISIPRSYKKHGEHSESG
jgi:hypothetical protein